ncbi:MAG: hypothetical protein HQM15_02195 [Deltaproteobacteria bacterium]|nr:hypothetical protein [Deltaproteobacteria bacterium]
MKIENISPEELFNERYPELDFLDQIPDEEWNANPTSSGQDHFIPPNEGLAWSSTQPLATEAESALELSESYLESIRITLQMMSARQVDHAPAALEVRQQLQRIQQELSHLPSSSHLDGHQRNQLRAIRLGLVQAQRQLARSERLDLGTSFIPQALLESPQMPRVFLRMAELRDQCAHCHSSSDAWHLIEQLRQLESQTQELAPQIIWQQEQQTQILNVTSLQDEIRNLRMELLGRIRRGNFQGRAH